MGDEADALMDMYDFVDDDDGWRPSQAEDYMDESDSSLRAYTSGARIEKIRSIRSSPSPLSRAQRYCLAKWIADADNRAMSRL